MDKLTINTTEKPTVLVSDESEKVDRISGLGDNLIDSILSRLELKEAGRTSVLSKRWRYIWTFNPTLNFDASETIDRIKLGDSEYYVRDKDEKILDFERSLYLKWVNQVLASYKGPLNEFKVRFDVGGSCSCQLDIDNWVDFALKKNIEKLELDFEGFLAGTSFYNFPDKGHITNYMPNLLINLRLRNVNVTGEVLEYLLVNCPLLEELSVLHSMSLVNLKVPVESFKLKRLDISRCYNVENIEIFAMNVTSFHYLGPEISFPFKNDQQPVEMSIGLQYCEYMIYKFPTISCYLSRLERLNLEMMFVGENSIATTEFPIFNKLKHLQLRIVAMNNENLLVYTSLIQACPILNKFVLQLEWCSKGKRRTEKVRSAPPHHHLKVVEFVGFVGRTIDTELATYLLESAVSLEKLILDRRKPELIGTPWELMDLPECPGREALKKCAEKFRTKLPTGAELVII